MRPGTSARRRGNRQGRRAGRWLAWHPDPVAVLRSIRLRPCFRQCKRLDPGKRGGWIPPSRAQSRRDVNEGGRKATESRTTDLLRVPTSCSGPFRQDLLSYIVSPQGYPGSYLKPRFEEFAKNGFQGLESVPGILFPGGPACPAAREPWLGAGPRGEATLLTEDLRKGIPGTTSTAKRGANRAWR